MLAFSVLARSNALPSSGVGTALASEISEICYETRRIFAFTRALCLGETLVFLDVVSQGFIL